MKRDGRQAARAGYKVYTREFTGAILGTTGEKDTDLRDRFAQFALLGMVQYATSEKAGMDHNLIAQDAYMLADAMMKERNRPPFKNV